MSAMGQSALRYARLGYRVFPVIPGKKKPICDNGCNDATSDETMIGAWWENTPNANIGISTEGLFVLDTDGADNPYLADHPEIAEAIASAPWSQTPRGGRHYFMQQIPGLPVRCRVGHFATKVDVRADGGYVVVAPSVVDGTAYRWMHAENLEVRSEKLPVVPRALYEAANSPKKLRKAESHGRSGNPRVAGGRIPEGSRNNALTRFAGGMRSDGMNATQMYEKLRVLNLQWCDPPLDEAEVEQIAQSIARYAPGQGPVAQSPMTFDVISLENLDAKFNALRAPVIHGHLRCGETMNIVAPPKAGKSWLALDVALSVAAGDSWLETFETVQGRVLIIDNELHQETLAERIPLIARKRSLDWDRIKAQVDILALRGNGAAGDIHSLRGLLESIEPDTYRLVVLDALYKVIPAHYSENDNAAMAEVFRTIDRCAEHLQSAFVLVHHSSKGVQSGKSITDVGAGAGSQSRAADTHLILRAHEDEGHFVMESVARSWPPTPPIVLAWEHPLWRIATDKDPSAMKRERTTKSRQQKLKLSVEDFVDRFVPAEDATRSQVIANATATGVGGREAERLLAQAVQKKLALETRSKGNLPSRFCKPKVK